MKATGIVRRIDDLGRVVIPKEIRRTMRIREGDPLEIYTDREGGVIFKKYSQLGDVSDFAAQLCDTISRVAGIPAVITDRDSCIAAGGIPRREVVDKRVSSQVEQLMEERGSVEPSAPFPCATEATNIGYSSPFPSSRRAMCWAVWPSSATAISPSWAMWS